MLLQTGLRPMHTNPCINITIVYTALFLIITFIHSFVSRRYTTLSTSEVFIIVLYTIWSYIIPLSTVTIQLKSKQRHSSLSTDDVVSQRGVPDSNSHNLFDYKVIKTFWL